MPGTPKFTGLELYLTLVSARLRIVFGADFRFWKSGEPVFRIGGGLILEGSEHNTLPSQFRHGT